jgi:hypothetical protein
MALFPRKAFTNLRVTGLDFSLDVTVAEEHIDGQQIVLGALHRHVFFSKTNRPGVDGRFFLLIVHPLPVHCQQVLIVAECILSSLLSL